MKKTVMKEAIMQEPLLSLEHTGILGLRVKCLSSLILIGTSTGAGAISMSIYKEKAKCFWANSNSKFSLNFIELRLKTVCRL